MPYERLVHLLYVGHPTDVKKREAVRPIIEKINRKPLIFRYLEKLTLARLLGLKICCCAR